MKKIFRLLLGIIGVLILVSCGKVKSSSSKEQDIASYPSKPVTIVVGYGAGGSSDLGVRMLQAHLEKELGQSVVVVNKTGAQGWVAWSEFAKAEPDGYTISLVNIPGFYSGYLDEQQKRKENLESFTFLANHVSDWGVLVVKKGKYKDMKDFIEKSKIDGVTIGDVGVGGNKHMAIEELAKYNEESKISAVHMKGWSDNYAALLGDTLDGVSATIGDVINQLDEGNLEILCIFSPEKTKMLPNISTCEELGYGAVYAPSARGFMLPAGANPELVDKIVAALKNAINKPEHIEEMKKIGLEIDYFDGEEYRKFLIENEEKAKGMAEVFGWKK